MKLNELTIVEMHEGLLAGQFTAVDLVTAVFEAIDDRDERFGAFLALNKEEALEQAKAADEAGYSKERPLNGIPIAIKDNIVTKNLTTTAASRMLEDFVPIYDATVIEKLKEAGAIIVGKVNLDEFAMGGSTETSYFKKTKNAHDLERVPGGSSGGSAVAVAAHMVPASLGSDTGGSIRQPAAFNGVVGMKPTYGRVSRYGLIAFASSLDQIGPMTKTVKDNALVLSAISGMDEKDSTTANEVVPHYVDEINTDLSQLTIGIPEEFLSEGILPEIRENVKKTAEHLKSLGATIKKVSLSHTQYGISAYYIIASSEASSNLQRFDGIRYGYRAENTKDLDDLYVKTRTEGFGTEVKRRILLGTFSLSSGYYDAHFKKAAQARTLIKNDFAKAFEDVDIILGPVAPDEPFKLGERISDPIQMYMADVLTIPVNLAGLPALSVPVGMSKNNLPIGVQFIGPAYSEQTLYNVGQALEDAGLFSSHTEK
ncbi:Asp-tRNA(Asn)/Glu-tRNA(Gln) amidotransferase subunit GatA [Atopobacter phocae]|uniref:Asp-tRNA(Asn)/Glu-tRNA(Gln) amidotransferase subunit GatA n=1 Tax=Atopobacter phocae TaxID=136492 RepID=UPI0004AFA2F1|nr:Asp-tRNA(Asn)/Glu-tRNA(Gln) amidotransferase subunit GatA [Atopobacter phocae]